MQLQEPSGLYDVYEVFVQYNALDAHQHVGSVLAASAEMAVIVARENFLRRDRAVGLWVVPKQHIFAKTAEDVDFFATEFDRDYRRVDGYSDNARRWKAFKQQALEIDDVVQDVREPGVQAADRAFVNGEGGSAIQVKQGEDGDKTHVVAN